MSIEAFIFVFGVLLAVIGFLLVVIINGIRNDLKDVKEAIMEGSKAIGELSGEMALIREKTNIHGIEIDKLKDQHTNILISCSTCSIRPK